MIDRVCNKINTSKGNKKGQQSFYELLPCRVEPMGETENFDPEDLDKIFEFMGMIEAYAEF